MANCCRRWSEDAEYIERIWDAIRGGLRRAWDHLPAEVVIDVLRLEANVDPFWAPDGLVEHARALVRKGNLSILAGRSGLARETLSRLRHGHEQGAPTFGTLLRILNALGLRLPFLRRRDSTVSQPKSVAASQNKPQQRLSANAQRVADGHNAPHKGLGITVQKGGVTAHAGAITATELGGVTCETHEITVSPQPHDVADDVARNVACGSVDKTPRVCPFDAAQLKEIAHLKEALGPAIEAATDDFLAHGFVVPRGDKKIEETTLTSDRTRYYSGGPSRAGADVADGVEVLGHKKDNGDVVRLHPSFPVTLNGTKGYFSRARPDASSPVNDMGESLRDFASLMLQLHERDRDFFLQLREHDRKRDRQEREQDRDRDRQDREQWRQSQVAQWKREHDRGEQQARAFAGLLERSEAQSKHLASLHARLNERTKPPGETSEFWVSATRFITFLTAQLTNAPRGETDG